MMGGGYGDVDDHAINVDAFEDGSRLPDEDDGNGACEKLRSVVLHIHIHIIPQEIKAQMKFLCLFIAQARRKI